MKLSVRQFHTQPVWITTRAFSLKMRKWLQITSRLHYKRAARCIVDTGIVTCTIEAVSHRYFLPVFNHSALMRSPLHSRALWRPCAHAHSHIMPGSHYSVCSAYGAYFSTLVLTDQSANTGYGCGPLVRSRSGASAAEQRSFPHRVYLCCTARTELKWQRIVCGIYEHGLTRKCNYTINANN